MESWGRPSPAPSLEEGMLAGKARDAEWPSRAGGAVGGSCFSIFPLFVPPSMLLFQPETRGGIPRLWAGAVALLAGRLNSRAVPRGAHGLDWQVAGF